MMQRKVALVLGSGGARGLAHIGVIKALVRYGFEITSISGTSMGAVVGGIYAAGKLDEYESWMCSLSKYDVFSLIDFTFGSKGIIKAERVLNEMKKFIPDRQIEELPVKFAAVASDILNIEELVITEGSLFEAIRASIAIPMLITPVKKNHTLIVDGGILNPVPVNRVYRHEDDLLIAVNVNANIPYQKPSPVVTEQGYFGKFFNGSPNHSQTGSETNPPAVKKESAGYFDLIIDSSVLMLSQITRLTLEMNPPDLLIEISRDASGIFDFFRAQELVELGEKATIEGLKKLD